MRSRCGVLAVMILLQGCYSYAPLEPGSAPVGQAVELEINDRGRYEMGDRLGRGVSKIEGRLTGIQDNQYLLNVAGISYLNGEKSRWGGEGMRLNRDHVERAAIRKLSRQRTWTAVAVAVVAFTAVALTTDLLVKFTGDVDDPDPGPPPPSSFRPRFILPQF